MSLRGAFARPTPAAGLGAPARPLLPWPGAESAFTLGGNPAPAKQVRGLCPVTLGAGNTLEEGKWEGAGLRHMLFPSLQGLPNGGVAPPFPHPMLVPGEGSWGTRMPQTRGQRESTEDSLAARSVPASAGL